VRNDHWQKQSPAGRTETLGENKRLQESLSGTSSIEKMEDASSNMGKSTKHCLYNVFKQRLEREKKKMKGRKEMC